MSKKITPGILPDNLDAGPWILSDDLDGIHAESGKVITKLLCPLENSLSKNIANAKLMAAAPEMLEALISARKFIQKNGINYDNADLYNLIDNAIKKGGGNE